MFDNRGCPFSGIIRKKPADVGLPPCHVDAFSQLSDADLAFQSSRRASKSFTILSSAPYFSQADLCACSRYLLDVIIWFRKIRSLTASTRFCQPFAVPTLICSMETSAFRIALATTGLVALCAPARSGRSTHAAINSVIACLADFL
jgi:hypothetical protein